MALYAYGGQEYQSALSDWQSLMKQYQGLYNKAVPGIGQMGSYYAPGGSYGQGQRKQAQENVQAGVGQDMASMVASGMSSMAGARGLNTRAGSELSKLYGNIEDTRAGLQLQSQTAQNQGYAQLMQTLAQMFQAKPVLGQYAGTQSYS